MIPLVILRIVPISDQTLTPLLYLLRVSHFHTLKLMERKNEVHIRDQRPKLYEDI